MTTTDPLSLAALSEAPPTPQAAAMSVQPASHSEERPHLCSAQVSVQQFQPCMDPQSSLFVDETQSGRLGSVSPHAHCSADGWNCMCCLHGGRGDLLSLGHAAVPWSEQWGTEVILCNAATITREYVCSWASSLHYLESSGTYTAACSASAALSTVSGNKAPSLPQSPGPLQHHFVPSESDGEARTRGGFVDQHY